MFPSVVLINDKFHVIALTNKTLKFVNVRWLFAIAFSIITKSEL